MSESKCTLDNAVTSAMLLKHVYLSRELLLRANEYLKIIN